jgi:hypothetical protein
VQLAVTARLKKRPEMILTFFWKKLKEKMCHGNDSLPVSELRVDKVVLECIKII